MVMLDHLRDLRASERLSSWLITVTKREAVRVMKRNLQRSGGDLAQELDQAAFESRPPITDDLAARLVDLQEQQIVRDALQRMPERCRLLLEMLFLADTPASYAEIAERLDMPIGSIGPTRKRCLGRLRKLLDEMGF
jgi:RNA polymerase sigma factor (sigma-70 family)